MNENQFFKPTILYKEYMILDMIEKNPNITQREMSKSIGIAVSMVNDYLDEFHNSELIIRTKHSAKRVEYIITKKGLERRKVLNIAYLKSSQKLYNSAKENIEVFLHKLEERGFKDILLYGAGEVCEILLNALKDSDNVNIVAKGIIDDDIEKIGLSIASIKIFSIIDIASIKHDGILISSYSNNDSIYKKLIQINYPYENIIQFFGL